MKEVGTSKKEQLLALISRKSGATLVEIIEATGWQKHPGRRSSVSSARQQRRLYRIA